MVSLFIDAEEWCVGLVFLSILVGVFTRNLLVFILGILMNFFVCMFFGAELFAKRYLVGYISFSRCFLT